MKHILYKEYSSLSKLIGDKITNIELGIGETLYTEEQVIYYIMLQTNDSKCLFFNNGDECAYSLDKINEILANDIWLQIGRDSFLFNLKRICYGFI